MAFPGISKQSTSFNVWQEMSYGAKFWYTKMHEILGVSGENKIGEILIPCWWDNSLPTTAPWTSFCGGLSPLPQQKTTPYHFKSDSTGHGNMQVYMPGCRMCINLYLQNLRTIQHILHNHIQLCLERITSIFMQTRYPSLLPVMTLALVLVTSPLLATISGTGLVFYLLAVFSVTFLCPTWLFRLQHLKK